MRKILLIIVGAVATLLIISGFVVYSKFNSEQAGIVIETNPRSTVYINDEQLGVTPYEGRYESGEVALRLVPIATDTPLAPWGTKITLVPGVFTVVKRDFGETESQSSGEILSFERLAGRDAALTVVSFPDAAQVVIDGQASGFTPKRIDSVLVGDHKVIVSYPGFTSREITAKAEQGYRLTVVAMLSKNEEEPKVDVSGGEGIVEEQVRILDTPTGFLRVRSEATVSSEELTQVLPGQELVFLEESEDGGWFKVEYGQGRQGWVSAQYAEKVEERGD